MDDWFDLHMNQLLTVIQSKFYTPCEFSISNYSEENESQEYGACRFEIAGLKIISRNAKITLKKIGQFVTIWKRSDSGITQPFNESDEFDFLVINIQMENQLGQFIFPKPILSKMGVITTIEREGKRGIRVYPPWNKPTSKQAIKTQAWQLQHFCSESSMVKQMLNLNPPNK